MSLLVVNHAHSNVCGIHDLGTRIYRRLAAASPGIGYVDAHSAGDLPQAEVTLFNYRADLMPWVQPRLWGMSGLTAAILHNYEPETLDVRAGELLNAGFDRVVVLDPGAMPTDPRVVVTGRFLPELVGEVDLPDDVCRFGSFGFAFPHKRFERVAEMAEAAEMDRPVVYRLHAPEAHFNGANGAPLYGEGVRIACLAKMARATLEFTSDHRSDEEVVRWLAGNHVNCLMYDSGQPDAGLSSALDYLLAARRPILVSGASMFRHGGDAVARWPGGAIMASSTADVTALADHYDATSAVQLLEGLTA